MLTDMSRKGKSSILKYVVKKSQGSVLQQEDFDQRSQMQGPSLGLRISQESDQRLSNSYMSQRLQQQSSQNSDEVSQSSRLKQQSQIFAQNCGLLERIEEIVVKQFFGFHIQQKSEFVAVYDSYLREKSNQDYILELLNNFNHLQNKNYKISAIQRSILEFIGNPQEILDKPFEVSKILFFRSSLCNFIYKKQRFLTKVLFKLSLSDCPLMNHILQFKKIETDADLHLLTQFLEVLAEYYSLKIIYADQTLQSKEGKPYEKETLDFRKQPQVPILQIENTEDGFRVHSLVQQSQMEEEENPDLIMQNQMEEALPSTEPQFQLQMRECGVCGSKINQVDPFISENCKQGHCICLQCFIEQIVEGRTSQCPVCQTELDQDGKDKLETQFRALQKTHPDRLVYEYDCKQCQTATQKFEVKSLEKQTTFECQRCHQTFCTVHKQFIQQSACFCFCQKCKKSTFNSGPLGKYQKCLGCGQCFCLNCTSEFTSSKLCRCRCIICFACKENSAPCICEQFVQ